jgi:hypothetical protein
MSSITKEIAKRIAKGMRKKTPKKSKKVKTKASTEKGSIGAGRRSAKGKGAKGRGRAYDEEPMRKMSDTLTASDAVSKGQAGRITTGKNFSLEAMRTASQRKRAKEFARIDTMSAKDRSPAEKKFHAEYLRKEARDKLSADISSSKTQRAKNKKTSEILDPAGEVTDKTTAKRAELLARDADVRKRIAADDAKKKKGRAKLQRQIKAKMAYGGMANKKQHMYVAGGSVTDNPGLRALRASGQKGREAYANIVKNVKSKRS